MIDGASGAGNILVSRVRGIAMLRCAAPLAALIDLYSTFQLDNYHLLWSHFRYWMLDTVDIYMITL